MEPEGFAPYSAFVSFLLLTLGVAVFCVTEPPQLLKLRRGSWRFDSVSRQQFPALPQVV